MCSSDLFLDAIGWRPGTALANKFPSPLNVHGRACSCGCDGGGMGRFFFGVIAFKTPREGTRRATWDGMRKRPLLGPRPSSGAPVMPFPDAAKVTWQSRPGSGWIASSGRMPLPLCQPGHGGMAFETPREGTRPATWDRPGRRPARVTHSFVSTPGGSGHPWDHDQGRDH